MGKQKSGSLPQGPRVSVIIPTFNSARFLPDALESVFSQDYPSFEVIVVDDGSTDETPEVLRPYARRVRILRQANAGVCAARNRGLNTARGELVVFLDADDLFLPGKLRDQAAMFRRRPSLAMVHSGWQLVDDDGRFIREIEPWRWAHRLDLETWLLWKPVFPGAIMLRRDAVLRAGGFDETLRQAEDVDLVLRIALAGGAAAWLRQPTVQYRLHDCNTIRDGRRQARDLSRVMDNLFARPDLPRRLRRHERRYRYFTLSWLAWQLHCTAATDEVAEYLRHSLEWAFHPPHPDAAAIGWSDYLAGHCCRDSHDISELRSIWPAFAHALRIDDPSWHRIRRTLEIWLSVWHPLQANDMPRVAAGLQTCGVDSLEEFIDFSLPIARFSDHTTVRMISRLRRLLSRLDTGLTGPGHLSAELYWAAFLEAVYGHRVGKAVAGLWRAMLFGLHPRSLPCWRDYLRQVPATLRSAGRRKRSHPELIQRQENPRG
jgi:glycosyltransferase involved in cell wall biosynthesis